MLRLREIPNEQVKIEALADKHAGNWRKFDSFAWFDRPDEDASAWTIVYTSNRDSDALTRSNARVIAKALEPFDGEGDCRSESHHHWACGHVDGYAIRVRDAEGKVTLAFATYARLALAMDHYPVLDGDDFYEEEQREADETWKNCYSDAERLEYVREYRRQFEFHDFADMLRCVRGHYFAGYASELLT